MIGKAAMPFCLHGFENAVKQARAQGFSGELSVQEAIDDSPDIDWEGDAREEVDFAWWHDIEQEILIEFPRLEIPIAELTPMDVPSSPERATLDPILLEGGPSGVQDVHDKDDVPAVLEKEEEEKEEEEAQLIRRPRRSAQAGLPSSLDQPPTS